ncbi:MAG: adenine phosphoribosyltransferase [Kiritimatiellae bacterium]|nr:adenine phosphoribosyltransferase [Kiritimatiellia bacterium]
MENILEKYVKVVPDFPKPGVLFRDVTGILDSGEGFRLAMVEMERALAGVRVDKVAAPDSRGFIFGAALADRLRCAFVPIRKPGKLPRETISEEYDLEYGRATVHMHKDALSQGDRVVLVDDLLATGGTALASARLVERLGGKVVKMVFAIELEGFGAVKGALAKYDVTSLVKYPGK